jgi:hypothetical protein
MAVVDDVWRLRRHRYRLLLVHPDHGAQLALGPSDRLKRAAMECADGQVLLLWLVPLLESAAAAGGHARADTDDEKASALEALELAILGHGFDSSAECDSHRIYGPLLWREPIEGAAHQVAVRGLSVLLR